MTLQNDNWVEARQSQKTLRALDATDRMPPRLRQCVHDFGYEIVSVLLLCGVTDPNKIRNIILTCWTGARQHGQRAKKGLNSNRIEAHIDGLLATSGSSLTAQTLAAYLSLHAHVILPIELSEHEVQASMEALAETGLVNKPTKHRLRLRAAMQTACKRMWPTIFGDRK